MGNHRFKLSDMMPNAWFYKLRDMSKVRSHKTTPNIPTKSLYYTPHDPIPIRNRMDSSNLCISPKFFDPPTKKRSKRKTVYMPSPRKTIPPQIPVWLKPNRDGVDDPTSPDADRGWGSDFSDGFHQSNSNMTSCSCSATDIIINVDDFDVISEPDLPPIQTKPAGKKHHLLNVNVNVNAEEKSVVSNSNTSTKFSAEKLKKGRKSISGGVKIGRKPGRRARKSVKEEKKGVLLYSESFAIVKASFDPEKDFRESMMEMIVENDIKAPKDLEELLASYLSLNAAHYHHLIIKAFQQIWFTINQLHLYT